MSATIGDNVSFAGDDPVFPMKYRLGASGASALAAVGCAVSNLWTLRGGYRQKMEVGIPAAAAAMRAVLYFHINGERPANHRDPLAGFYPVRDGRWIYLHVYFPEHRDAALKVLEASDAATAKLKTVDWDGEQLETAIHAAGGCACFVRTRREWEQHPQYRAIIQEPLFEISRVGDAPPRQLSSAERPLGDVRVLDLTRILAGPVSTRTLAEHGADVLRITGAHLPDLGPLEYDYGVGKLSAALDLRRDDDRQRLKDLIATGDVFVQSYRPGSLEARGFGVSDVAAMRPGIVYSTLSAWGYSGPWSGRRGYDSIVQCANGMVFDASVEGERPKLVHAMPMDYLAGYLLAYATIVALARQATEGGTWSVRVSLARVGEWFMGLGDIPETEFAGLAPDFDAEAIRRLSIERETAIGSIQQLKPVLLMSETPPFLVRPPVRLGSQPAEWPS